MWLWTLRIVISVWLSMVVFGQFVFMLGKARELGAMRGPLSSFLVVIFSVLFMPLMSVKAGLLSLRESGGSRGDREDGAVVDGPLFESRSADVVKRSAAVTSMLSVKATPSVVVPPSVEVGKSAPEEVEPLIPENPQIVGKEHVN